MDSGRISKGPQVMGWAEEEEEEEEEGIVGDSFEDSFHHFGWGD